MDDVWAELGPIYRRKINGQAARVAWSVRLNRPPHRPKPTRIIAVIYGDGEPMDEDEYSLRPFYSGVPWSGGCLFFRYPVCTSRMTILFEAA